jgi:hypothetical protein
MKKRIDVDDNDSNTYLQKLDDETASSLQIAISNLLDTVERQNKIISNMKTTLSPILPVDFEDSLIEAFKRVSIDDSKYKTDLSKIVFRIKTGIRLNNIVLKDIIKIIDI